LQNYFISAPTLSQLAASASFECRDELEAHVTRYRDNLEVLLEGLPKAGFAQLSRPDGAFYLYCEVSELVKQSGASDSLELCTKILMETVCQSYRIEYNHIEIEKSRSRRDCVDSALDSILRDDRVSTHAETTRLAALTLNPPPWSCIA
jgi:hypothetical protein